MRSKINIYSSNVSTFIISLIPLFKSCPPCPICMPKYAALFGFFGLKLADYSYYLEPLMAISMLITLATMLYETKKEEKSYLPSLVATFCCAVIFTGKFSIDNFWITQIAVLGLFSTIILHYLLPIRKNQCCT